MIRFKNGIGYTSRLVLLQTFLKFDEKGSFLIVAWQQDQGDDQ